MRVDDFDKDCMVLKKSDFFYLWCCDCKLRHLVVVDIEKSEGEPKVKIGMVRDQMATEAQRKSENIVLYKRNVKDRKHITSGG
tara:strand:- start:372 stop:620 length:249 start_codon:yes stop_codon:yes gene_type:complete